MVRRRGPVIASFAVHTIAVGFAISALGAAAGPQEARVRPRPPREKVIEVALLADTLPVPPPPARVASSPPAALKPLSDLTSIPAQTPPRGRAPAKGTPQTPAPGAAAAPEDDGVSFGGSPDGLARGLAGLTGDPCRARIGPKPRECSRAWAGKGDNQSSVMPLTKEEQAKYYAEYMPKCPWNVGCEGGEWISTNGTRSVGRAAPGSRNDHGSSTPMAAGAAGLGGLHDSVGRLGFNPDHFDRGFGD